jgi:hypothetical protein
VALGGGGLALFGVGCLWTWPTHLTQVQARLTDKVSNLPVLRIHAIFGPDPRIHAADLWIRMRIRILLFSSVTFKTSTKNVLHITFEGTFTSFFKDKIS